MSGETYELLSTRKGRIFFVHLPIAAASLMFALLFSAAARGWSNTETLVAGGVFVFFYVAFVVVPLLILIAPVKKR